MHVTACYALFKRVQVERGKCRYGKAVRGVWVTRRSALFNPSRGTFIPCFLWIFLGAPYIETLRGNRALGAALSAITAAVVGVILNLAVWFALHAVFADVRDVDLGPLQFSLPVWTSLDPWAALLAAAAMVAMFRFHVGMLATLAGCAAAGAVIRLLV